MAKHRPPARAYRRAPLREPAPRDRESGFIKTPTGVRYYLEVSASECDLIADGYLSDSLVKHAADLRTLAKSQWTGGRYPPPVAKDGQPKRW
jgi:hypothetical protein